MEGRFEPRPYTDVNGAGYVEAGLNRLARLEAVGGNDDGHVGEGLHYGDILGAVVGGARLSEGDSAVGAYGIFTGRFW